MHVPDGFLDAPTSIVTGALAVASVGVALKGARRELSDKTAPLTGVVAAFIFATQMINFPVGAGTSGHLLGGTLAAILVGPWTAILCISVVLIVQCLLFADGGVTALGTNVMLMGVLAILVGWLVSRGLRALLPKTFKSVAISGAVGAFVSVPVAAGGFALLYAIGGTADIPLGTLAGAMIGWHLIIGVGEAVITFAAVSGILAVRPDLVYAAKPVVAARNSAALKGKEALA